MSEPEKPRIKPLFIVKPGMMSRVDIRRVEKQSGFCVVECAEPDSVRHMEPPIDAEIGVQARAALSLMRSVLRADNTNFYKVTLMQWFLEEIMKNTPPPYVPSVPTTKRIEKK